jgi:hypothetical protein
MQSEKSRSIEKESRSKSKTRPNPITTSKQDLHASSKAIPKLKFSQEAPTTKDEKFTNFTKITARKSNREGEEKIVLDPEELEETKLRKSIATAVIKKKKYKSVRTVTIQGRTFQRKQEKHPQQNQPKNELYEKVPGLIDFGFDDLDREDEDPELVEIEEDLHLDDEALLQKYLTRADDHAGGSAEVGRVWPLDRSSALHNSNGNSISRQELTTARKIKQVVQYIVASASSSKR